MGDILGLSFGFQGLGVGRGFSWMQPLMGLCASSLKSFAQASSDELWASAVGLSTPSLWLKI